jgi:hypothetical protein
MWIYSRYIVLSAVTGAVALSGLQGLAGQPRTNAAGFPPPAVAQQDTSKAMSDTSMGTSDTSMKKSKKSKKKGHQTGAPSDTALHAKPGVQTGPTDSTKMQRPDTTP